MMEECKMKHNTQDQIRRYTMKKCYECKCALNDLYIKEIEINVGGPNEGCIEWTDEYHIVPLCDKCYERYETE